MGKSITGWRWLEGTMGRWDIAHDLTSLLVTLTLYLHFLTILLGAAALCRYTITGFSPSVTTHNLSTRL